MKKPYIHYVLMSMAVGSNGCWVMIALNILRPRQNGRHFVDDIFKSIFSNEDILNRKCQEYVNIK